QAESAAQKGKWIFWDLDLGFQEKKAFLQDSSLFFAIGLAIEEFFEKLWKSFQKETLGVSLFKGSIDFSKYFVWTEQHEQYYLEKEQGSKDSSLEPFYRKLFAVDVFAAY